MNLWLKLQQKLFSVNPHQATFAYLGFRGDDIEIREHLKVVPKSVLQGYHLALSESNVINLATKINTTINPTLQGFAFEGAAMGLTIRDYTTPKTSHYWQSFVNGPAINHSYMAHIGVGMALARLPVSINKALRRFDPMLRWLILDGYGFHAGFFNWSKYIEAKKIPNYLNQAQQQIFDQGLGRSLWFVELGGVNRIMATIATFPAHRQANLWSGIGLACAYAGGVTEAMLKQLKVAADPYHLQLAQGVILATKTRHRAENIAPHTTLACQTICNLQINEAVEVFDQANTYLKLNGHASIYSAFQQKIQTHFKQLNTKHI